MGGLSGRMIPEKNEKNHLLKRGYLFSAKDVMVMKEMLFYSQE